jgi:pimeloyl-ACP methyl ester carboxylesterase
MKFLFKNESFSFEALRAAGFANYGGADVGEVIALCAGIPEGDEAAWLTAWKGAAERAFAIASTSLAKNQTVSAREAFLRASNYYRTAEFFQREAPASDPAVAALSDRACESFVAATKLMDAPVEGLTIPYAGTTLPAYFFRVDGSKRPRPTIIYNSGFDSTQEEAYFAIGAAALRRGYNVLTFDGPGQGAALRRQNLAFRPDWEAVLTPVLDYALSRPEVDPKRIVAFGYSFGGYLVARAAAFEHRLAALVLDDGIFDFAEAFRRKTPAFLRRWVAAGKDDRAAPVFKAMKALSAGARWGLNNGKWTFGASSEAELLRKVEAYSLAGIADQIRSATLILDAEDDVFLKGQPHELEAALTCNRTLVTLTRAEGAGEHCHMGAMARMHQVIFDWLAETLP